MKLQNVALFGAYALPVSSLGNGNNKSLIVDEAPNYVRPYVLPRFKGRAVPLTPSQPIRFSITVNSTGGAFSMVQHSGKISGWTPARPHTHKITHEYFYCARGRIEVWSQKNETGLNATQEARVGTVGDFANVPQGNIHTFQLIDPDSQMTHIFNPAGFEHLFDVFSGGHEYVSDVSAPYPPNPEDGQPFQPLTPSSDAQLRALDTYAASSDIFIPRRDMINGTAGSPEFNWHNGENELATDPTDAYFVANNYGPKYLNTDNGYKVIQPLVSPAQTRPQEEPLTIGTIIMSPKLANETVNEVTLPNHFALQMDDGLLVLEVTGYPPVSLLSGDVAFIPKGTHFKYHTDVPMTKFLYLNAGAEGLDTQLLATASPWGFPGYPQFAGYKPGEGNPWV